jgi:hypothetical protein
MANHTVPPNAPSDAGQGSAKILHRNQDHENKKGDLAREVALKQN